MFGFFRKPKQPFTFYPHTPDAAILEESEFQLLFICGTMMHNRAEYSKIEKNSEFLWRAFTYENFSFFCRTLPKDTPLPIPLSVDTPLAPRVKIFGEVHKIKSEFIKELDILMANRVQFQRQKVKVMIPGRWRVNEENHDVSGKALPKVLLGKKGLIAPETIHLRNMWMYVGIPGYWEPLLDGGYFFQKVTTKLPYRSKTWLGDKYYLFE